MSADLKQKILGLIEQTNDPGQKAQLLVQLQIIDLLAENTDATRQIADDVMASRSVIEAHRIEFSAHNTTELQRQAAEVAARDADVKARKSSARWFGVVQTVIFAAGGLLWHDYTDTKVRVAKLEIESAKIKERHEQEDKFGEDGKAK